MFLDEELKQIYETHHDDKSSLAKIIYDACIKRIDYSSQNNLINSIKRIDTSYRLFTKTKTHLNADFFKNSVKEALKNDEKGDIVIKLLKW